MSNETSSFLPSFQAISVDPGRKLLYWTDSSEKTIKRAVIPDDPKEMGYPQDLKITGIGQPSGIAFDWVAKWVIRWQYILKTTLRDICISSMMFVIHDC